LEASYWKEIVNSKIKFIINNHTWKLVNLSLGNTPLGHKVIFLLEVNHLAISESLKEK
jgi:hypothetical protein